MHIRKVLILAGLAVLLLSQFSSARAAELRYIRIGEHKDFTRIVFEFRGSALFENPVITDKGKFSMVFSDTTTTLPRLIPGETTKRIKTIEFINNEAHLIANIALSFPYFKIKSFSLSDPMRVVLDINRLDKPPEGIVRKEPLSRGSHSRPLVETQEKEQEISNAPALMQKKGIAAVASTGADRKPDDVTNKNPSGKVAPKTVQQTPQQVMPQVGGTSGKGVQEPTVQETAPVALPEGGQPPLFSSFRNLQTYLLLALTVFSLIIIALLFFIVFGKKQKLNQTKSTLGMDWATQERMEELDTQIEDELKKIGQP